MSRATSLVALLLALALVGAKRMGLHKAAEQGMVEPLKVGR